MLTQPPQQLLDLLVVGGLTIDRFADGRAEPGGSVLHVARGLAGREFQLPMAVAVPRLGIVTSLGAEPEVAPGLKELRTLAEWVLATPAERTATFRHRETPDGRRLWLEQRGGAVVLPDEVVEQLRVAAILYAPVAGEVASDAILAWDDAWRRGAILQGWLRSLEPGEVEPLPLAALDEELVSALSGVDLLVASREDLLAEAPDAYHQLKALRGRFGANPCLVVTDGAAGLWISAPQSVIASAPWHVAVPRRVDASDTVGAGDVFAAAMLASLATYQPGVGELTRIAERAMLAVADWLERRPPTRRPGAG